MTEYTVLTLSAEGEQVSETIAPQETKETTESTAETNPWHEPWQKKPAFSSERLELAGQVALIGMLMVFAVLTILWVVLSFFKLIFVKSPAKNASPAKAEAPKTAPAAAAPIVPIAAKSDDGELVAIITAAVAAYRAEENPSDDASGFRVVSFRRANGGKPWNSK